MLRETFRAPQVSEKYLSNGMNKRSGLHRDNRQMINYPRGKLSLT